MVYCGSCLKRVAGGTRWCHKCLVLTQWPLDLSEVTALRVKDLRQFLHSRRINTATCTGEHNCCCTGCCVARLLTNKHRCSLDADICCVAISLYLLIENVLAIIHSILNFSELYLPGLGFSGQQAGARKFQINCAVGKQSTAVSKHSFYLYLKLFYVQKMKVYIIIL